MLELQTQLLDAQGTAPERAPVGRRCTHVPAIQPALVLQPDQEADRLDLFAADAVFLNPAARSLLLALGRTGAANRFEVQIGLQRRDLRIAGRVALGGGPLLVMDVAACRTSPATRGT